jgi:hypothetical protein
MEMKKRATLRILLVVFILAVASLACVGGVDNNSSSLQLNGRQPELQSTQAVSATATYGAEQFQIQLTAIAEQKTP